MAQFFPDFQVISKKSLRSPISMGPTKPSGPFHGPLKPYGAPKIYGTRGHSPPSPLSEALASLAPSPGCPTDFDLKKF